jgi:hypothetical protein
VDGKLDRIYPLPCYAAAIKLLPRGLDYSNPADDIQRAYEAARRGKLAGPSASTVARGIEAEWFAALKAGAASSPKQVFKNPPFKLWKQRLKDAARANGFEVVQLYIRWPRQQAPFVIVKTSYPAALAKALPALLRTLDPKRNTGDDRTGWAYEGFFFEAINAADGQPFLIVHNHWRGNHAGGGQWASSPDLLPLPHG